MAKGNWTGTATSSLIVEANAYREYLVIQHTNATQVAIGIGEAAVAGEGVQLVYINDAIRLEGAQAQVAIYGIGDGGTATYQDGNVTFSSGPYVGN